MAKAISRKKGRSGALKNALIFIDTNIFLDFYRIRGAGSGLKTLDLIDQCHERLITGNQVEMEFKKNRQKAILESLGRLKRPDWSVMSPPAFLAEAQASQQIEKFKKSLDKQQDKIKTRLEAVLRDPTGRDPVYQCLQRLFKNGSQWNLDRSKKFRRQLRRLAYRRFLLGYPPRKTNDSSMGDAVNWEWIIQCAKESGRPIIIVSRDSDYGATYKDQPLLNDALFIEFQERVSFKRKIILTDRLTAAFKLADISVTPEIAKEEEEIVDVLHEDQRDIPRATMSLSELAALFSKSYDFQRKRLEEMKVYLGNIGDK